MTKVVAVIGCGLIGQYHVNSLINAGISVLAVDPHINEKSFSCEKYSSLTPEICERADVLIVSTRSDHRYKVINEIEKAPKNHKVILEKPLFVTKEEYRAFSEVMKEGKNEYFVNLPNYYLDSWERLAQQVNMKEISKIAIHGNKWGMGCNILHDVSILMRLCGSLSSLSVVNTNFTGIEMSWRHKDFIEIYGNIELKLDDLEISISCVNDDEEKKKNIDLYTREGKAASIDIYNGCVIEGDCMESFSGFPFAPPRASDSTAQVVEDILNGVDVLPQVSSIFDINLNLYKHFSEYVKDNNLRYDYPFT